MDCVCEYVLVHACVCVACGFVCFFFFLCSFSFQPHISVQKMDLSLVVE